MYNPDGFRPVWSQKPMGLWALSPVSMGSHVSIATPTKLPVTRGAWRHALASYTTRAACSVTQVWPWVKAAPLFAQPSTVYGQNPENQHTKNRKLRMPWDLRPKVNSSRTFVSGKLETKYGNLNPPMSCISLLVTPLTTSWLKKKKGTNRRVT